MNLLRRIARLLHQSRIRLPEAPLRPSELRPGDWIQFHDETWRVAARRYEGGRAVFTLERLFRQVETLGAAGALVVLVGPHASGEPWTLKQGGSELSLPPEFLVVFPVV